MIGEIITHSLAALIGGGIAIYLVKHDPERLQKWIDKAKAGVNKL